MYDIIIVGCGPAGMTAAIYALRSNKKVLILESEGIGGQIASSPLVENYPGFIKISGSELVSNLYNQVINLGAVIELDKVVKLEDGKIKKVVTENNVYETKSIIIATGSKQRKLSLPNEEKFIGAGISFCTTCDGPFYKDKIVAVAGGGSAAVTNALYLSTLCKKVYLIHRNESFKSETSLLEQLKSKKNTEVITNANIIEYLGDDDLTGIKLNINGKEETLDIDGLFLSIGSVPLSELAGDMIKMSDSKYIVSDENCETNIKGIFIAGDAREKSIRQLTTATSDGTIAAINAIKYLNGK